VNVASAAGADASVPLASTVTPAAVQPQSETPAPAETRPVQIASSGPIASQPAPPASSEVEPQPTAQGESRAVQLTELQPSVASQQALPPVSEPKPARQEETRPIQLAELQPSAVPSSTPPAAAAPADSGLTETAPASFRIDRIEPAPVEIRSGSRLADVAAVVATLPDPEPAPKAAAPAPSAAPAKKTPAPARISSSMAAANAPKPASSSAAAKKAPAPAKPDSGPAAAKPGPAKKAPPPAAPKEPSRVWVQVAGGADKTALPRTFANLKTKAPKLLGARTAWTTPLNATNRLLVGPFESTKEAQAFVNELAKLDLSAFAWTSEAGQKIERLAAAK
jgi:hypothetical protein